MGRGEGRAKEQQECTVGERAWGLAGSLGQGSLGQG